MSQYIPHAIHYRFANFTGLILSAGTLALLKTQPPPDVNSCLFCTLFDICLLTLTMLFLLAWLHNPRTTGQRIYATLGLLTALPVLAANGQYLWLSNQLTTLECSQLLGGTLLQLSQRLPLDLAMAQLPDNSLSCNLVTPGTPQPLWLVTAILVIVALTCWRQLTRKPRQRALFHPC